MRIPVFWTFPDIRWSIMWVNISGNPVFFKDKDLAGFSRDDVESFL